MRKYSFLDLFRYRRLITTADGSPSFYLPGLDEQYHSVHGAMAESLHVFIRAGFDRACELCDAPLRILEVGLGTGLNALLSLKRSRERARRVFYHALEPYPLEDEEADLLNFSILAGDPCLDTAFKMMHRGEFDRNLPLMPHFGFLKTRQKLEEARLDDASYHLVYHDAFGPQVQPELWGEAAFGILFAAMRPGGLLTTYSAKGSVKRALKNCGFRLEALPGPAGKREITRASKPHTSSRQQTKP